jgi:hypothetical protein
VTRKSIREYTQAIRNRYRKASKKEKTRILDEFTKTTGLHRKAAIRLLNRVNKPQATRRQGRPRKYSNEVVGALKIAWEAGDRLCSKRLHPFLPEMVRVLRENRESNITVEVESQLCRISPSTIDRLLHPFRQQGGRRSFSTTKPGSLLKNSIPIRTFTDWEENRPGYLEADTVAHCGDSVEGFYLNTLMAVDVVSGWAEGSAVWGKSQERVGSAIHGMRRRFPFPILGLDTDNGGEFINRHLFSYCRREHITFTRSRSYKKNDNCYVEQKNGNVVRRVIGYDRYSSRQALETLNQIYYLLRLYINFFQPVMKLVSKTRHGARVHKVYDTAKTPYQRLLDLDVLTEAKKAELATSYSRLNPVKLLKQINQSLEHLWTLKERTITLSHRINQE